MHAFARRLALGIASVLLSSVGGRSALAQSAGEPALVWTRFEWVGTEVGPQHFARAALFVPITLEGVDGGYFLQHDLGSDQSMLYELPFAQVMKAAGRTSALKASTVITGKIGGLAVEGLRMGIRLKFGDPLTPEEKVPVIGTLGLDFFEHRRLLLDYPAQRMAVLPESQALPADLEKAASFVPVTVRNGKLFVPVTINGRSYPDDFFFDTGASLMPIVTTRELWREMTGRTGDEPNNPSIGGQSWDNKVKLVGAPIRGEMSVGTVRLNRPLAYFDATSTEDLDFTKWPYPVKGVLGNACFFDGFLVIVDLPHRRLGVIRQRAAGAN